MIFSLFKSKKSAPVFAPAAPEDARLYVIGDVHGRADLVERLARLIEADLANAPRQVLTIFLGDYVDRGPRSAEVIDRLSRGAFPTEILALRGNHEQMLLQALEDDSVLDSWRKYGGLETMTSYGVDVAQVMRGQDYDKACARLAEQIPDTHRAFLNALPLRYEAQDYFFCHAGVRPGVPLAQQVEKDLLWIGGEFLSATGFHGKQIVHGHTAVVEPELRPNRINIDTGAYATGKLTCLALEGASVRLIST